jgi:hypothetical protein
MELGAGEIVVLGGRLTMKVTRAAPWYKRPPRILWEDSKRAVLSPWRKWREARREKRRIEAQRREAQASRVTPAAPKVQFYFASENPVARDKPAVELVYEYLRRIETEIETFERRFGNT